MGHQAKVRFLALPKNIGLGRKWMAVENALAYYIMATFTTVKSFILLGPGASDIRLTKKLHLSLAQKY